MQKICRIMMGIILKTFRIRRTMKIVLKMMDKNMLMRAITMQRIPSISRIKDKILKIDKEWWLEISSNSKKSQKKRKRKLSDSLSIKMKYNDVFTSLGFKKDLQKWHWYLILIFSILLHLCLTNLILSLCLLDFLHVNSFKVSR